MEFLSGETNQPHMIDKIAIYHPKILCPRGLNPYFNPYFNPQPNPKPWGQRVLGQEVDHYLTDSNWHIIECLNEFLKIPARRGGGAVEGPRTCIRHRLTDSN